MLDRNDRLLELARHNGYGADVREPSPGFRVWMVPPELREIAGFMAARVR